MIVWLYAYTPIYPDVHGLKGIKVESELIFHLNSFQTILIGVQLNKSH
jgi:hypothetical protein